MAAALGAFLAATELADSDDDYGGGGGDQIAFLARDDQPKVNGYWEWMVPEYSDCVFRRTFRTPRSVFDHILEHIEPAITDDLHFGGRVPVEADKKLAMYMKFVGSKNFVLDLAQEFNVSTSTFIKSRRQVSDAIVDELLPIYVNWPRRAELQHIAQETDMEGMYRFPNVVGFLDGSHIPISRPWVSGDSYYNRKKFFSVVLQGVCREDLSFTDVSVGCPGRMHDAKVLRLSSLWNSGFAKCERGDYHLLADAAYPIQEWLITPYRDYGNLTDPQKLFNKALSSKRQKIERAFGMLKRRFPKMGLGVDIRDIDEVKRLVMSCCVLHNICIKFKDFGEDLDDIQQQDPQEGAGIPIPNRVLPVLNQSAAGRAKRENLTQLFDN